MKLLTLLAKLAMPLAVALIAAVAYLAVMYWITPAVSSSPSAPVEDGMNWYPVWLD